MDSTVVAFRKLHESGCFVLPNPWDPGSAVYLKSLGFKALATTSAGYAFSQALPDGSVPRDRMLRHIREIVAATPLPVNADFEGGFAVEPEETAINAVLCSRTGAAGLSIEDSTHDAEVPLLDRTLAVERIKAVRSAIDGTESGVVITARCEAFLWGVPEAQKIVLDRLVAFAAGGGDCLYAPGIKDPAIIADVVKAVAPRPVNVLAGWPGFTVKQLEDLGVRRISVGGAMARAAWAGFVQAAKGIAEKGTFDGFAWATPGDELNNLFKTDANTRAG